MWSSLFVSLLLLAAPSEAPLTGEPVLTQAFAQAGALPEGFVAQGGRWTVADGRLKVDGVNGLALLTLPVPPLADVAVEVDAAFDSAKNSGRWLALVTRLDDSGFTLFTNRFDRSAPNGLEIARGVGSVAKVAWRVTAKTAGSTKAETGVSHRLRTEVRGGQARAFIDGVLVLTSPVAERDAGRVGLLVSDVSATFGNLRVEKLPPAEPGVERGAPIVVGHRGNSAHAPENTLASAREAFDAGASVVEVDVRRSRDGHIVLLHDGTFQRTAGDPRKPEDMTLAEIKQLDAGSWKDARYKSEPVPTLAEMLDLAKGRGSLLLDLKQTGLTADIARLVVERGMEDQVLLGPWTVAEAAAARASLPNAPIVLICSVPAKRQAGYLRDLLLVGVRGFNAAYGSLTPEFMREAAQRGMAVYAWTVNGPADMQRLASLGVTGILTDDPGLCVKTLDAAR